MSGLVWHEICDGLHLVLLDFAWFPEDRAGFSRRNRLVRGHEDATRAVQRADAVQPEGLRMGQPRCEEV